MPVTNEPVEDLISFIADLRNWGGKCTLVDGKVHIEIPLDGLSYEEKQLVTDWISRTTRYRTKVACPKTTRILLDAFCTRSLCGPLRSMPLEAGLLHRFRSRRMT